MISTDGAIAKGRVLQVNVSNGGVPKLPVDHAWVGRMGVVGDAHHEPTVHGGPHRAVCLFGIEAIERLQSEGHPISPGSAGENLTTTGIDWSLLQVGSTVRVGEQLELELSDSTTPCSTQTRNFSDGNFNRILIDRFPSDSRMYARVLREGEARAGDPIVVCPPAPDSRAADELLLKRLDRAEGKSSVAAWNAARDAGFKVTVFDDGELVMSAAPELPGPAFNQASGFARLPNLLDVARTFYNRHGTTGYIWLEDEPWQAARISLDLEFYAARPQDTPDFPGPEGVVIRRIHADEIDRFNAVRSGDPTPGGVDAGSANPWPAVYELMARTHQRQLFIAEMDGIPVANASLHVSARTGWLRGALTAPHARGRGIQRALIAVRARAAAEAGCDLIGASAEPGETSARNMERMGMRRIGHRTSYEYVPAAR